MWNWTEDIIRLRQQGRLFALVTVSKVKGSAPCKVGSRMIVDLDGNIWGTIGGGRLEYEVISQAKLAIANKQLKEYSYTLGPEFEQCCGGVVELIIEPMNQEPKLYIFGAGHIGLALCDIMKDTAFQINLMDTRPNWIHSFSSDRQIAVSDMDFDLYKSQVAWGDNTYVVILTHDHKLDFEITALALSMSTKYIGLIGSKTKAAKFESKLKRELSMEEGMTRVDCPMGIDLGGNHPKEIALSIAAKLLKMHYGK